MHERLGNGGATAALCSGRARGGAVDFGECEASKTEKNEANEGSNGHIALFTPHRADEWASR